MVSFLKKYKEASASAPLLAAAIAVEYYSSFSGHTYLYLSLYVLSYLAVGGPVWIKAYRSIRQGNVFSEFFLMGIATVGAFAIGEYAEGVAVMLFYTIGEYAQHGAVHRARHSIKKLISRQPESATVERDGATETLHPSKVRANEIIRVKPGERVPLDGELLTESAFFNTAALTGESKPMRRTEGDEIWAGSINGDTPVRIRVTKPYRDTRLAGILEMVQDATLRKAPTQRFMTKFARIYTPVVVWLAVALTVLPWFFVDRYLFQEWFYRALIFLVVSCPCGLVISIPLGYFGGIGAASRNGILLKGSDFLDRLRNLNILFLDKTGTVTQGTFEVQAVQPVNGFTESELLEITASLEKHSTHPIGRAITRYADGESLREVQGQREISGQGLTGTVDGRKVVAGSRELLSSLGVAVDAAADGEEPVSYVHVAVEGTYSGYIAVSDRLKEDSRDAVDRLRSLGVDRMVMLSGDKQSVVNRIAEELGLDGAYGGLMPEDKYSRVKEMLDSTDQVVGFVGDGVNDAPVITLADVGIAMGGIGSDASVDTADVVIQTDQLTKIPVAITIARFTHRVVWQNIGFALGVKILVMALAAVGMASMWEAIFADVGVALIAIANAIRIQRKEY
ncbi:MAG: heavy metal translocating P-type ATPase [Balneolaceae bacterium]|nr:heavy metal translocating P-type ATPase [Balneolaceae bacterium]